jgi:hypothetical protein
MVEHALKGAEAELSLRAEALEGLLGSRPDVRLVADEGVDGIDGIALTLMDEARETGDPTLISVGSRGPGRPDDDFADGLGLGDAIRFFLDAKRAGGRSERTISEYRKKLDLFERWAVARLEGEGAVDAPVSWLGPDEVEGYVVRMRGRALGLLDQEPRLDHPQLLRHALQAARRGALPPEGPEEDVSHPPRGRRAAGDDRQATEG